MRVEWYGQSAFRFSTPEASVFIDPFADLSALAERMGVKMDYPRIEGVAADLVLVTHEHPDHNGVEAIEGSCRCTTAPIASVPGAGGRLPRADGTRPAAIRKRVRNRRARRRPPARRSARSALGFGADLLDADEERRVVG